MNCNWNVLVFIFECIIIIWVLLILYILYILKKDKEYNLILFKKFDNFWFDLIWFLIYPSDDF